MENKDYVKLYNDLKNPDVYNQLSPVLKQGGPAGEQYDKIIRREIIDKTVGPLIEKGASDQEIRNALVKTNIDVQPEEVREITRTARREIQSREAEFAKSQERYAEEKKLYAEKKATKPQRKLDRKAELVVGKTKFEEKGFPEVPKSLYEGKEPEEVARRLNTVSGVKDLEKNLSKQPEKLQKIKKELGVYRIYNGKIKESAKIRSIAGVLEDADNLRYLKETLGKDVVEEWQDAIKNYEKYEQDLARYEKELSAIEKSKASNKESTSNRIRLKINRATVMRAIGHQLLSPIGLPPAINQIIIDTLEKAITKD